MKIGVWVLAALTVASLALTFLPEGTDAASCGQASSPAHTYAVSAIATVLLSFLTWYGHRTVKAFPFNSVAIDDDGIWQAHLGKERGLIPWSDVVKVREREYMQRLDLLGRSGVTLLKVEYQLALFDQLRSIIDQKTASQFELPSIPVTYAKTRAYHFFNLAAPIGFGLLGWYVIQTNAFVVYVVMVGIVIAVGYEYLTTAWKVTIDKKHLHIQFPATSRTYFYPELESVQICDSFYQGVRHPEVGVFVRNCRKPLRLRNLGVDAFTLHQIITAVCKNGQNTSHETREN